MKIVNRFITFISAITLSSVVFADSDVRISIDEGVSMAQPIAVIPFKANAGVSADVAQIISDDLRNSGKFTPFDRRQMPTQPSAASEVNAEQWSALGLDHIVVGQVSAGGRGYVIAYQLIDTLGTSGFAGNVIAEGAFDISAKDIRQGAHAVSDQVFEKLTSIQGAFRTKIAYVVQRGVSSYELRVSDYDGHNALTVFTSKEPIMSPTWSPDGNKLAYVTFENKRSQIVSHDLRNGARKVIAALKGHNGAPAFSPDGRSVAFASNQEGLLNIYIVNAEGGSPRQLTSNAGNNTEPSWSPDGSTIVFTSDRAGAPQVFRMNTSGGGVSAIGGGSTYNAKISSDNKNLIMISGDRIVKRDLVTGSTEVLSSTFLDESPSISPNGIMIIYSSTKGTSKVLQLVSADGRFKASLPGAGGHYKFPAWSPYLFK